MSGIGDIENWTDDFLICVIDDGSDGKSLELIEDVKSQNLMEGSRCIHAPTGVTAQSAVKVTSARSSSTPSMSFHIDSDRTV